jgi:hypothetical protein
MSTDITQENQPSAALSELLQNFLGEYRHGVDYDLKATVSPIEVDQLASKLAKFYEKIRRVVDWKEENLMRRTAIERILKRTLLSEISGIGAGSLDSDKITEPLVMEVVRSGYFVSGRISKNKIPIAKQSLAKYIYILNNSPISEKMSGLNIKEKVNFFNWILEIAACEIEEILQPSFRENALINMMTTSLYRKVKVKPANLISDEEILVQSYVAVHRALFSLDAPIITYNLIKYRHPRWFEDDTAFIKQFTQDIEQIKTQLDQDLEHQYSKEFFKIAERYDAAYLLLGDVMAELEKKPDLIESKLANQEALDKIITERYNARLKTQKRRLFRSAVFSTLSIFAAGIVSFIIFEGPIARMVRGHFSWFALLVDLAVPALLMFILVATIKPPKKENLARVIAEIHKIVFFSDEQDQYDILLEKKKRWFLNTIFALISAAGGITGGYAIFMLFKVAGVPWTSIYIDTVNVAMVIAAAMVIRHKAREITIEERGSFISMTIELFSLPLAKVGQWFSDKWKEYNILSVFFIALVDMPFSVVVGLLEDWRSFLRDRRSEIH